MRRVLFISVACVLVGTAVAASFTQHVDPFIGTGGTGHVTPAAAVPFGMVMPGPDNAGGGWSFSSGYQYRAPKILGISNTHISGAGIPELGDVLLQPSSGQRWSAATADFGNGYANAEEAARPGCYRVRPRQQGVNVELTTMQLVAFHRYTFGRPDRVRGPRGGVIQAPGGHCYSTLGLWDTIRTLHPLHTLLVPERVAG